MPLLLPTAPVVPLLASDLIPYADAAHLKGCTAQTLRNAAQRGQLTEHRIGRRAFLVRDDAFDTFEVEETGGRLHRKDTGHTSMED